MTDLVIAPAPETPGLTQRLHGQDHNGEPCDIPVIEERPLTIFLNSQEIVTSMTIGDHPELLALGYLRNQRMLREDDDIVAVEHDSELGAAIVRTRRTTDYEEKLQRRTQTSGCAQGTVYGNLMEELEGINLPAAPLRVSWLYALSSRINRLPSLYLYAGAIHGTVLCRQDRPLIYMEDVGRHNAVDKVSGWLFRTGARADDKILYTTGRLTSEMVIKTAIMGIPALVSRSGFTAFGVGLARQVGLTLVGRLRGRRFVCLSGAERLVMDANPALVGDEHPRHRRKAAL